MRLVKLIDWVINNADILWHFALIGLVLFVLALIAKFSKTLKAAYEGFRELFTLRGMFAALIVMIVIYVIWKGLTQL